MDAFGRVSPLRTCVGCRRVKPVDELVRVARSGDGTLLVGRNAPGRGAWLCAENASCLDAAISRKAFSRAFRGSVSAGAIESLRSALSSAGDAMREDG